VKAEAVEKRAKFWVGKKEWVNKVFSGKNWEEAKRKIKSKRGSLIIVGSTRATRIAACQGRSHSGERKKRNLCRGQKRRAGGV